MTVPDCSNHKIMSKTFLLAFILFVSSCSGQLNKVEGGYKGNYVVATRWESDDFGKCLSFNEVKFMGMIDRVEVSDIIKSNNGQVVSGDFGGLHIVLFKGMDTKLKMDSVIKVVLPKIEYWYKKNKNQ